MKALIQGKYYSNEFSSPSSSNAFLISDKLRDGSSFELHSPFYIPESIKTPDTAFQSSSFHPQLPPVHNFAPIKRPIENHLTNIHLKIQDLLQLQSPMIDPEFKFDTSTEAASFNWNLLSSNNFNLESILNRRVRSATSYGSEFKSTADLEPLLQFHPRWPILKEKLENGSLFPLAQVSEVERSNDLEAAFTRGNHKSAQKNTDFLAKAIKKETKKGWLLCLPEDKYNQIPGLCLSPMGVAEQLGVTASGEFEPKLRVTHDLSFPGAYSNESINSRVLKEELEPCMFGHAFIRIIHYIVKTRSRFPDKKIWIRKEDLKSAYRRMHVNAKTSLKSAIRMKVDEIGSFSFHSVSLLAVLLVQMISVFYPTSSQTQ